MKTIVYQSCPADNIPDWIGCCLGSVRDWAMDRGFAYRFDGDEFFDVLPDAYRSKAAGRGPVLSDLARLIMARNLLGDGLNRVIWVDADVLIFDPENFTLSIEGDFAFCREIWVQPDGKGGVRTYSNVHNAVAVFDSPGGFLEFYIDACQRIVERIEEGSMVNQIVGPKFLGALHNMIGYPLIENVGMLSPLVLRDIDAQGGPALDRLLKSIPVPMQAANLCSSLVGGVVDEVDLRPELMMRAVDKLLKNRGGLLSVT